MNFAIALNFQIDSNSPPDWLLIVPAGRFEGRDSRWWVNSQPRSVIGATVAQGLDVVIDVEHATHLKAPKGEAAPARGWVKAQPENFEIRDGAIWGRVTWNAKGKELLEGQEYRYYSPGFHYNASGVVIRIESIGLTNKANLPQTPALNRETEDSNMNKILGVLALAATATEDDAVAAINQLKIDKQLALNRAETPDAEKFVPIETHTLALNRADDAEQKLKNHADAALKQEAELLVDAAIEGGKCAPANREHFLGLCRQDGGLEQVKTLFASAPKVMPEEQKPKADLGEGGAKLSAEELAICRQSGLPVEDYLAAKAEEA